MKDFFSETFLIIIISIIVSFFITLSVINIKAEAVEMRATVEKSDYYKCVDDCQASCLEFIK